MKNEIKLVETHDYITLSCPAGNFTMSYSGSKISGS